MEVAQILPGLFNGSDHVVFLDVHMEGIQQHFGIGVVYALGKGHAFFCRVHQILLKAVYHFKTIDDIVILRRLHQFLDAGKGDVLFSLLFIHINSHGGHALPPSIGDPVKDMRIYNRHRIKNPLDMFNAISANRFII